MSKTSKTYMITTARSFHGDDRDILGLCVTFHKKTTKGIIQNGYYRFSYHSAMRLFRLLTDRKNEKLWCNRI